MSRFTDAIDKGLDGLSYVSPGACPGCSECGLEDVKDTDDKRYEEANEHWFSWRRCECCGSTFGGMRRPAHYLVPDENGSVVGAEIGHLDICEDCLVFLANGDEPESWGYSSEDYGPN